MKGKYYGYGKEKRVEYISRIHTKVNSRGGEWVSGECISGNSVCEFRCADGHVWATKLSNIQTNRWCPACAKIKAGAVKTKNAHIAKIERQIDYIYSCKRYFKELNKEIKILQRKQRKIIYHKEYNMANREKIRLQYKDKYDNDISFRLNELIKSQMKKCLVKDRPMGKYYEVLGYTTAQLYSHLEVLFNDGMSWENIGEWHIDHVKPKSWFNLTDAQGNIDHEQVRLCWSLSNLQPLWAVDNISKRDRYVG